MTFEIACAAKILASIGSAVAPVILQKARSKIDPTELEKAIRSGVESAQKIEEKRPISQQLFYHSQPDFVPQFLEKFLRESAEELQKPLDDRGMPDVAFLVEVFKRVAAADDRIKPIPDRIELWVTAFVEAYFEQTKTYLRFRVAREDYLKQLANYFDDIKFAGIGVAGKEREKSQKLLNIFVMPDVEEERDRPELDFLEFENANDRQFQLIQEQRLMARRQQSGRKFSAAQLFDRPQTKRVVVLGAPGSGKTTLASYVGVMLATPTSDREIDNVKGDLGESLPIIVRIRDWERQIDRSILDYARHFAETTLHTKPLPVGFFEHWLESGRSIVVLDGLDEVADEGKRYEVVRRIENFLGQFDLASAIITSRPAGYRRDFFRTEEYPHYWLQPFDDEKMEAFIHNWYDSRIADPAESQRRQANLRKALKDNDRIRNLARNPLLLTIIALIHRYEAVLPKQRHKLYDRAVETLLTSWDAGNKELTIDRCVHLDADDWRRLMEQLAYWVQSQGGTGDAEGGTLIDRDELTRFLAKEIAELKSLKPYQAKEEAKRFLAYIRERTGLLNEQGQDCYAFVHKTFQEYLAARDIDYRADGDDDFGIVLDEIRQHCHDSHWQEVLLLLVAQQKRKKAAKAIRCILELGSEYENWLHRDLLFAGMCLAEDSDGVKQADSALWQGILDRLVVLEVDKRFGSRVGEQVFKILSGFAETAFQAEVLERLKAEEERIDEDRLLKYRAELGEEEEVTEIYLNRLKDEDSQVRSQAAYALGELSNASEKVVQALLEQLLHLENLNTSGFNFIQALIKLVDTDEIVHNLIVKWLQDRDNWISHTFTKKLISRSKNRNKLTLKILPLLKHDRNLVRLRTADVLGTLEKDDDIDIIINHLLEIIQNPNIDPKHKDILNSHIIEALGNSGKPSSKVYQAIFKFLDHQNFEVRSNAVEALGRLGQTSDIVIDKLMQALNDEKTFVIFHASQALLSLGQKMEIAIESLNKLIRGDNMVDNIFETFETIEAFKILKRLDKLPENSSSTLLKVFRKGKNYGLYEVAELLDKEASDYAISILLERCQNADWSMKNDVAIVFDKLGNTSEKGITLLLSWLSDEESFVCERVARTLGNLGKTDNTVISAVVQWLEQHPDSKCIGYGIDALWDAVAASSSRTAL